MAVVAVRALTRGLSVPLSIRLARRELRGGIRGLGIVFLCLALGVAVISAVGTLHAAIDRGLAADGRGLLGGDLEIDGGAQPLPEQLRAWLRSRGAILSDVIQMRSMLVAPSGERQLVQLQAVDGAWPLVGTPVLAPEQPLADALARRDGGYGLLAQPLVLERLGLHPGETVRLGNATFRITAALVSAPDQLATPSLLGPRVVIASAALPQTGLVVPGSMVRYALRVTLPASSTFPEVAAQLRAAFPEAAWRIRSPHDVVPGVMRFFDQTSTFLTLVGLTSLLVGGIGVANGVRAWLDGRARTIATLRCLGASSRTVFAVCLIQVSILEGAAILAGLLLGSTLPLIGIPLLRSFLPVAPLPGVYPSPLILASAYGALTALAFALWPLGRAARIPGAALFRDTLVPERVAPGRALLVVNLVLGVALAALTVASTADRHLAADFCAAAIIALSVFRLGGAALSSLARAAPQLRWPWARHGVRNLHRPGNSAAVLMVSAGLGLSTLAAVALIEANIRHAMLQQLPARAPSFFFIDIQDDQRARFDQLARSVGGIEDIREMPSLRARIVAVNGVPAEKVPATASTRWALRGDHALTWSAAPPPGTKITAGQWWALDYQGPPLVSFDANLARGWHAGVGDTIRLNVLGRDIDLRIANLREIDWRSLSLNFILIASPGLLAHAPHTTIAAVRVAAPARATLLRVVTDTLPNVTAIAVDDVLTAVANILRQVAGALAVAGSVTLVVGATVLVSAMAAGQRRRTAEAVILKTLGATRAQIRAAWLVEFGLLGLATGVLAAATGTAASYGVVHYIMQAPWVFLPWPLVETLLAALAMMLIFGYRGIAAALRSKAGPLLRNE